MKLSDKLNWARMIATFLILVGMSRGLWYIAGRFIDPEIGFFANWKEWMLILGIGTILGILLFLVTFFAGVGLMKLVAKFVDLKNGLSTKTQVVVAVLSLMLLGFGLFYASSVSFIAISVYDVFLGAVNELDNQLKKNQPVAPATSPEPVV